MLCPSCGVTYSETTAKAPIRLDCGCNYCRSCTFELFSGREITCSIKGCGPTPIPPGGIDNLAVDFALLGVSGEKKGKEEGLSNQLVVVSGTQSLPSSETPSEQVLKILCDDKIWKENLEGLKSKERVVLLKALVRTRQRLSLTIDAIPIAQKTVDMGFLPYLIPLLSHPDHQIVFEAAWAISNVASGSEESTQAVVDEGGIVAMVKIMNHPSYECCDQAVWGMGNILGNHSFFRECVAAGGVKALSSMIEKFRDMKKGLGTAVWAMSNFGRAVKHKEQSRELDSLTNVAVELFDCEDEDTLVDLLWFFSYLADHDPQEVERRGVAEKVMKLLEDKEDDSRMMTVGVRLFGNLTSGSDSVTQSLVDQGFLRLGLRLLNSAKTRKNVMKEICWALSNVAAGTDEQRKKMVEMRLFAPLGEVVRTREDKVAKEAMWCFENLCESGSRQILKEVLGQVDIQDVLVVALKKEWSGRSLVVSTARYFFNKLEEEEAKKQLDRFTAAGGVTILKRLGEGCEEAKTELLNKIESLASSRRTDNFFV